MKVRRWIGITLLVVLVVFVLFLIFEKRYPPEDWTGFDALQQKAPRPALPVYHDKQVPYDEYIKWVYWGEEWFRNETFGNERIWTDVVGFLTEASMFPSAMAAFAASRSLSTFSSQLTIWMACEGTFTPATAEATRAI